MKWTKALKYYAFQMLCDRCDNVTTWQRDNCTLERSFAAIQTEAAHMKFINVRGWVCHSGERNGEQICYLQCELGNTKTETSSGVNSYLLNL
jgi:hypothetical protein